MAADGHGRAELAGGADRERAWGHSRHHRDRGHDDGPGPFLRGVEDRGVAPGAMMDCQR